MSNEVNRVPTLPAMINEAEREMLKWKAAVDSDSTSIRALPRAMRTFEYYKGQYDAYIKIQRYRLNIVKYRDINDIDSADE